MGDRDESVIPAAVAAVAFCPIAPALVPDIAQDAAAELADVREICLDSIRAVWAPGRQLVLVGPGLRNQRHASIARGSFAGFGVDLELALGSAARGGRRELPLSLTVGAWLVRAALGPETGAIGYSVTATAELSAWPSDVPIALVVMGDGSARRSTAAPGYLDDRAEPFDAHLAATLRAGDGAGLRYAATDPSDTGAELLVSCLPAWHAASRVTGEQAWRAELHYEAAPYGVGYFVATWTR